MGSIVLIKKAEAPEADVVDGQQRLTTLTLLLAAIRSNVEAKSAADVTQLLYEKGSQILGTQDRYRLSLRARDQEFFRQYVQREGGFAELLELNDAGSDSRKNLRDNARLFDQKVKALPEGDRTKLAQFIVTRCYLVAVATPDLDSAYRIFSVLNSRGLDLSATDILKAEIVGGIPEPFRDSYTSKWEQCEDDLGRDDFNDLFSQVRMVFRKSKPQGTLVKEFRDHVIADRPSTEVIDHIILPMAEVYEQITDAAYSSSTLADQVNDSLKWLNRLEFKDWLPPALAFAAKQRNQPARMLSFFNDLERLAYGLLVSKSGINERIDRFSKVTAAIDSGQALEEPESPLQLSADEQYEIYRTLNGQLYATLAARARSTVLLRIDALMSGGGAVYDYDVVTVEHVLPQNPPEGSEWVAWFPDPQQRAALVHRLGNLALLTRKKNSAASNYSFERKKDAYFSRNGVSPFVLTTQVLAHSTWNAEIIEARQIELVSRVESHWRLEDRKKSLAATLDELI